MATNFKYGVGAEKLGIKVVAVDSKCIAYWLLSEEQVTMDTNGRMTTRYIHLYMKKLQMLVIGNLTAQLVTLVCCKNSIFKCIRTVNIRAMVKTDYQLSGSVANVMELYRSSGLDK